MTKCANAPIIIITTCDSKESSELLAKTLVEEKHVACVNIIPGVKSFYRWQGELREESEYLLLVKSLRQHFYRLCERIKALHTYDMPEIVALEPTEVEDRYAQWLTSEAKGESRTL